MPSPRTGIRRGNQTKDKGPEKEDRVRRRGVESEGEAAKLFINNVAVGLNDGVLRQVSNELLESKLWHSRRASSKRGIPTPIARSIMIPRRFCAGVLVTDWTEAIWYRRRFMQRVDAGIPTEAASIIWEATRSQ